MKEIGVRNLAWATPVGSGGRDKDTATVTVRQGDTLAKLAARLGGGITVEDLRRANPQLADVDQLPVGMELNLPTTTAGDTTKQLDEGAGPTDAPSPSANWGESRFDGAVYRAFINSPAGHFGNFGAYAVPPVSGQQPDTSADVDPRFKAVNQALQAGNATNAIAAAKELIAALQSEKSPQRDLLNHAHMALAAASLLNNDLESAGKALRTISPGTLEGDDRQRYAELRDLVKDGRREAFSHAFDADTKAGGESNQQGRAAAKEAEKLVEFIQATEPGNTKEIAEAKLKQANALLLGGNYRDAEKALRGIDEKQLDSEQKEHFTAVQDELHAQQVDALARGFDYDMKHKRYKQAVSNATAMVNNIAKHFPDRKEHLVLARLQQTTAQIMSGEMDAARQSIGRINRDDLKQMPKDAQARYRELAGALREHFENVKKLEVLKADQAAIQEKLKTIDSLTTSGDKAAAQKAVSLAEELVTTIQEKYPDNADAMAGAKMTLANAKMAAGNISGAKTDLEGIIATAKDPAIRDQARLLQARVALREGQTDKGVQLLQALSENGATPELRKAAKQIIISIESDHLNVVDRKAELEAFNLDKILTEKRSGNVVKRFLSMPSKPLSAMDAHERNLNTLMNTSTGAAMAASVMRKDGLTLAELQKMSRADLAKRVGDQTAAQIQVALNNPDAKLIAKHDFKGHFSWENNRLYADPSYLDSSLEKIGQWVGDKVRGARKYDEELKGSDSIAERAVGYASAFILDKVSDANNFIKDKIKTASDFYNDPERKDTWYAKLGRAGTFGADMLTSTFTLPATIVDYKASDKERSGAIVGTLVMAATIGAIRNGGPAWKSLGNGISKGASRIGVNRVGQWIGKTEVGQWMGRTAGKIGEKAVRLEKRFEQTGFAQRMDKVKDGLGKLNPTIGGPKPVVPPPVAPPPNPSAKTVDDIVDDVLKNRTPADMRNSITADEISKMKKQFEKEYVEYWEGQGHKGVVAPDISDKQFRRMVLGDKIYFENYNPTGMVKKAKITQSEYEIQFGKYDGPVKDKGPWHIRANKTRPGEKLNQDWLDGDVRRVYFNVQPDKAVDLANHLAQELNRKGIQFQFKIPRELNNFSRSDAGVLLVEPANYQAAKDIALEYVKKHPEALAEGSPAFTKPIGKGISAAHEPIQQSLPVRVGKVSHGESRSDIIAEAILDAPANATKAQIQQLVREKLKKYGFDPDRPWLKQGAKVDDL